MTGISATNWSGNIVFGAAHIHRPGSIDELRRLVGRGRRIRALGSGHSFSPVADTSDDLVRLDGLPPTVEIDAVNGTATVAAGMRYAEVAERLHRAGFALPNLASLPHISVAGSCATATHGSGDGQPCLSASVAALRIIGPDGDPRTLDRGTGAFPGSVVALGAAGIVTHLTLDIEPAFDVAQRVHLDVRLDEVAAHFDEVFGAAYSVSAFTDWRSGKAAVWLKYRTDRPAPVWDGGRPATHQVHPIVGFPPETSTRQLGVPGPWHERLPHFRPEFTPSAGDELQSEWFLPRDKARAAFTAIRAVGEVIAPVLHVSEVRTVRADDLWLSPAYGRDSVTLHFTWLKDAAAAPAIAELDRLLLPLGARPHWGKLTTAPPSVLVGAYERAADFAELIRGLDPAGKFRSRYVDDLFPAG